MLKVHKTWGNELWVVNREYCGKILNINKDAQCSLHYHLLKDETFYLLEGKIKLKYGKQERIMNKGDVHHIKQGVLHRFKGLEDSVLIEFSTHHLDSDSYRIEESRSKKCH